MKYKHEDGTLFTKEEFLQKLKTDKEFNDEFGNSGIDQIANLINDLKTNPDSRRLMVSAWNPSDLSKQILPPCHYSFQCYTKRLKPRERLEISKNMGIILSDGSKKSSDWDKECDENGVPSRSISLMFNMRSVDVPLGLPFNLASYGFLLEIIAKEVNMIPDEMIASLGDTHIYSNQIDGINEQIGYNLSLLERLEIMKEENPDNFKRLLNLVEPSHQLLDNLGVAKMSREPFRLPKLIINKKMGDVTNYSLENFEIINYKSHPSIKMPLSN